MNQHNLSLLEDGATTPITVEDLSQLADSFPNTGVALLDLRSRQLRFEMCRRMVSEHFGGHEIKNWLNLLPGVNRELLTSTLALAEYRALGLSSATSPFDDEKQTRLRQEIKRLLTPYGGEAAESVSEAYMASRTANSFTFPEVGYTPANLDALLKSASFTRQDCADALGVSLRSVQSWCAALDNPSHADMPAKKWVALQQMLLPKLQALPTKENAL